MTTSEEFTTPCRPHTFRQYRECVDPGDHHAAHRQLTDLVLYTCNCGYSSGWVPADTMPLASDFIEQHLPSADFIAFEEEMTRMQLGCTCDA